MMGLFSQATQHIKKPRGSTGGEEDNFADAGGDDTSILVRVVR
jgi:hypothetical protein